MSINGGETRGCAANAASLAFFLVLLLHWAGCSLPPRIDDSETGKTITYRPGSSSFDMEAVQVLGDSLPAIDLYLSIPHPSLIFGKTPDGFRSLCEITLRLSDYHTGGLVREVAWPETTFVEQYESTQSPEPVILRKRVDVAAGTYRLEVTLEDRMDARTAVRALKVAVIDTARTEPVLGQISIVAKRQDGTSMPQISFFVPVRAESIDCQVGAFNIPGGTSVELSALRFAADTTAALPPYYSLALPLPLGHSMILFDRADTVGHGEARTRGVRREEMLDVRLPPLRQGTYRLVASAVTRTPGGANTVLSSSRYYSIKGPGFPRPVTYSELIDAAVYIATDAEMRSLREARPADEQRRKFEEFWLRFAEDPARASALIKRYYGRVEEANRLFTIVREGWRSARGMLYCILGPPAEITEHLDTQTWYYELSSNEQESAFLFQKVIKVGEGLSVEDYYLYRGPGYESIWTRMVARWRGGMPP